MTFNGQENTVKIQDRCLKTNSLGFKAKNKAKTKLLSLRQNFLGPRSKKTETKAQKKTKVQGNTING